MPAIATTSVIVLLLLLPLKFPFLPSNMSVADAWAGFTLPLCWVALVQQGRAIRLPYLPAFLLILVATVLASLLSADPAAGFVVVLKDLYLYAWLVTLAAAFEHVGAREHRALLRAWCASVALNAAVIVAQFAHPPLLQALNAWVAGGAEAVAYRPSGLMANSNAAAGFQVLGFVPLVLLASRAWIAAPLLALNTAAILCTGSLGAALALVVGVGVGLVVLLFFSSETRSAASLVLRSVLAGCLCLALAALLMRGNPELEERLQSISWDRSDRSAEGRFEIWNRGADTLMSGLPLWGIGPDRFRQLEGSEMHNDLLGFAVERGLLGLLGLCLLGVLAFARSIEVFRVVRAQGRLRGIVFPGVVAATFAASLTHEVFHSREVWLALAVQEAALWRARRGPQA
ncbi:MAG TPA: O-antigen ligase family protein [Planctomycetota bacterium]|nr:O-antigen ligase family protein [Planctomycetota bacterium]